MHECTKRNRQGPGSAARCRQWVERRCMFMVPAENDAPTDITRVTFPLFTGVDAE